MERTIVYCDHCGKQEPGTARFSLEIGSQMDGAGSRDYITEDIDLCPSAQRELIEEFILGRRVVFPHIGLRHEFNKAFVARWKKFKA